MTSRLLIAIALLATAAAPAPAIVEDACCACLPVEMATTSGPTPTQALFCGLLADREEAEQECAALGGRLLCFIDVATASGAPSPLSCQQQLAGENIACPSAERAPVAGTGMLIGLAALLGLAGAAALRRAR